MRRTLTILLLGALLATVIWLFLRPSPEIRTAKIYAKEFRKKIQSDSRFKNVEVVVFELGDKSPIGIRGFVANDSDLNELHRILDSLHCPVRAAWYLKSNSQ
jgi:hypothetical protein